MACPYARKKKRTVKRRKQKTKRQKDVDAIRTSYVLQN